MENPVCIKSANDGRALTVSWEQPILNAASVIDYIVEVKRYFQPPGSRILELRPLDPLFRQEMEMLTATIMEGVGKI